MSAKVFGADYFYHVNSINVSPREQWRPEVLNQGDEPRYSSDQLLDAYLQGKEEALSSHYRAHFKRFQTHFDKAAKACEDFALYMIENGVENVSVRLRIGGLDRFTAMFVVSPEDYFDESFDKIYQESVRRKKALNSGNFDLGFIFTDSDDLQERLLIADGFSLRYDAKA
jgi:hypothetical protein